MAIRLVIFILATGTKGKYIIMVNRRIDQIVMDESRREFEVKVYC